MPKLKHHILPHPKNKTRATLLKKRAFVLYSVIVLGVFSVYRIIPKVAPGVLSYASNINVDDLLKYTNSRREAAGVSKLTTNSHLAAAARKKAEHMFKNNYWAHVSPSGVEPWSFILAEGYDYLYAGENLAKNFNSSKDVVDAWYKSPSHKENLINDRYTEVGFAAVNGVLDGYETTLVVQMFGRTRNGAAEVAVNGDDTKSSERTQTEAAKETVTKKEVAPEIAPLQPSYAPGPKIDVYTSTRIFMISFAVFMFTLFALDIWYSNKHAILKCTGHSLAHMAFLIFAITVIIFSLEPGRLI